MGSFRIGAAVVVPPTSSCTLAADDFPPPVKPRAPHKPHTRTHSPRLTDMEADDVTRSERGVRAHSDSPS